jgi:uncharacterized protein YbcV (DUF1398 family)
MQANVENVMKECTNGSADGRLTFPEVVRALTEIGVERYHADLQRSERVYYMPSGESVVTHAHRVESVPAARFDGAGVDSALRRIQAQRTTYKQFCEEIAVAGCVGYVVSLAGSRTVYFGRSGETFVEPFPRAT